MISEVLCDITKPNFLIFSGENITHVLLNTGLSAVPIFLYGVCGDEQRHDASYYSNIMRDVLMKLGSERITAIITDNAAVMVKAAEEIENTCEGVIHVRCACHSIHLLIGKIIETRSNELFIKNCKEIVKCIKNKSIPYAIFCKKRGTLS